MKRNIILLIVLVLLGALVWWLAARDRGTTLAGPLSDFTVADTSKVSRIFIAERDGRSIDLVRAEDGWHVNGAFRVKKHHLDLLLKTFLRVEVKAPVPKSAEANVLKTMSATSKVVEIYEGGDEPSKIWIVGHPTQDQVGTYMVLEVPGKGRSNVPFIMGMSGFTGHLASRFHSDLDEWRSSEVFAYADLETIASVRVEHPAQPATSFALEFGGGSRFTLRDGSGAAVPMDSLAVKDFLLQFKKAHYEYIARDVSAAKRDSVLAAPAHSVVTVTDRSGGERRLKVWAMRPLAEGVDAEGNTLAVDPNRMYGLMGDSVLVVVQRHIFDRITLPLAALKPN